MDPDAEEILAAVIAMVVVAVDTEVVAVAVDMAASARVAEEEAVVVVAVMDHAVPAVPAALLADNTGYTNTRRLCPD